MNNDTETGKLNDPPRSVSRCTPLFGSQLLASHGYRGSVYSRTHGSTGTTTRPIASPLRLKRATEHSRSVFGDDIGIPQICAYTMGLMGYRTPNIDCIAKEGAIFNDLTASRVYTAGRASFILGQTFRTDF